MDAADVRHKRQQFCLKVTQANMPGVYPTWSKIRCVELFRTLQSFHMSMRVVIVKRQCLQSAVTAVNIPHILHSTTMQI